MAGRSNGSVVWADLLSQAGANARPLARYLVFMAAAGIIAAFGVIYDNGILIVGAMAISPDTLPVTATCTGLVVRRWALAGRAFATLTIGLAFAGVVAGAMTLALNALELLPAGFEIGQPSLQGLTMVNISTPIVALAAGVAAVLALETRSSSSVGVAISVTTIPASAYLGVAAGVGESAKAAGALLVLGIDVAMLIVGGCGLLLVQQSLGRRDARGGRRPSRGRANPRGRAERRPPLSGPSPRQAAFPARARRGGRVPERPDRVGALSRRHGGPARLTAPAADAVVRRGHRGDVAACVATLVASTSGRQRHGGGVRPSSGKRLSVAVMSVAPNAAEAHGSPIERRSVPCSRPNAEP